VLRQVADGILVHESAFCQSNAVVVEGAAGVLLIDPGVHETELACLVNDLSELGQTVVAGFATHPHWDHMLWHAGLGDVPRHATALAASTARERLSAGIDPKRLGIPEEVSLELMGDITGLPDGATRIPWEGPEVAITEHRAHAPGHAALVIGDRVLVAGDMLSDVLVPILDLRGAANPIDDYLDALDLLARLADGVDVLIPGHGSVASGDQIQARIEQDRAYVHALRDVADPHDPRLGRSVESGWGWVSGVHDGQAQQLARMRDDGLAT
jgi:glyoxylase-like metal-dependent hydrolase (beta-lactamase superfamily II)